jgi:hypothetical protein
MCRSLDTCMKAANCEYTCQTTTKRANAIRFPSAQDSRVRRPSPLYAHPTATSTHSAHSVRKCIQQREQERLWTTLRNAVKTIARVLKLNTHQIRQLHPLPLCRFHVLLHSLFKVLFNFPSRYLFAIGLVVVFSLR